MFSYSLRCLSHGVIYPFIGRLHICEASHKHNVLYFCLYIVSPYQQPLHVVMVCKENPIVIEAHKKPKAHRVANISNVVSIARQ